MKKVMVMVLALAVTVCGCVTTGNNSNLVQMTVSFSWQGIKAGSTVSPKIKVSGFPSETKYFLVTLRDLDAPGWNHGGGRVKNDGTGIIPAGALKGGYNGPNPPGGTHRYQFTVKAVNAKGAAIGIGRSTKGFSK